MDNPDLPGTQRVETLDPKPPEVWPTILITISAIPISLIASLLAILVGVGFTQGAGAFSSTAGFELTIIELSRTPAGFLLLLLPGQLVFLFAAYVPCFFSSTPLVKRLGLVGGSLPSWSYPILILATPAVGMVGQLLPPLIDDTPSDQLLQIIDLIQTPGPVLFLFILMSISVLPAVAEETLFRGFLLMGLRRRWPAIWGILFSSVLFSAAHLDLQHAVGVFPLALWLGILTWRSGSILPAMLVHMVNNLIGGISIRLMDKQVLEEMSPAWTPASLALLACGTIALCGSIWILIRFGSRPENADNQKGWQVGRRSVP